MKRSELITFIIITIISVFLLCSVKANAQIKANTQIYNPTYTNGYIVIDGKVHNYHSYEYKYGNVSFPLYNEYNIYGSYKPTSKEWDYGWVTFSIGSAVALVCGVCWAACYYAEPPTISEKHQWDNALAVATYCGCGIVAVSIPLICVGDKKNKELNNNKLNYGK